MAVITDVSSGSRYSEDKDGPYYERVYFVDQLPSTSQALYVAGLAVPQMWQPHESIPGLFVNGRNITPFPAKSRTSAQAVLRYGWLNLQSGQIRVSGVRKVLRASRDPKTGNPFTVTYTNNAAAKPTGGTTLLLFDIDNFHLTLEVTRVEQTDPMSIAPDYVGRVNSDGGFQGIGDVGSWMCQSIDGVQIGNGMFRNTYVLEYAPEYWWEAGWYKDKATQIIPEELLKGAALAALNLPQGPQQTGPVTNGIFAYVPDTAEFGSLNLPQA